MLQFAVIVVVCIRWVRAQETSPASDAGEHPYRGDPAEAADTWSLFADREMIEARLTDVVRAELATRGIVVKSESTTKIG